jgi:hypothetical protein
MFKEFENILLRMDSRVFKKYKKFPVGDLYKVKIQILEDKFYYYYYLFTAIGFSPGGSNFTAQISISWSIQN